MESVPLEIRKAKKTRETLLKEHLENLVQDLKDKLRVEVEGESDPHVHESLERKLASRIDKKIRQSLSELSQEVHLESSLEQLDQLESQPSLRGTWRPTGIPEKDLISSDLVFYNEALQSLNNTKVALARDVKCSEAQIISLQRAIQEKSKTLDDLFSQHVQSRL